MTQPPQPQRFDAGNPYAGTPQPLGSWGPSAPAYPLVPATEHPQASTVLLLGVLGLVTVVTAPFAWALGSKARAEVAAGRYAPSPLLNIGWALGILVTIALLIGVAFMALGIVGVLTFRAGP